MNSLFGGGKPKIKKATYFCRQNKTNQVHKIRVGKLWPFWQGQISLQFISLSVTMSTPVSTLSYVTFGFFSGLVLFLSPMSHDSCVFKACTSQRQLIILFSFLCARRLNYKMLAFLGSLLLVAMVNAQRPEPCGKYVLFAILYAFDVHPIFIFFLSFFFSYAPLHVKFIRVQ